MKITDWQNCYDLGWGELLTPEAYSHPAKFSRGLIFRIVEYLLKSEMVKPGDTVIDPFGGVGLGSIYAADNGVSWIGVELERDFTILAHRNFYKFAKERWCTCGDNGNAYLRSMQQSFSEKTGRSESSQETKDGAILQPGLPQQISMFGEAVVTGTQAETKGTDSVEQRQALESRDAPEVIGPGIERKPVNGEQRELARGQAYQAGWIRRDQGERQAQTGTRSHNGTASRPADESGRDCSSQERESPRQPSGESGSDDNIGTYETASPERNRPEDKRESLRDLRSGIPEQPFDYLRAGVQAAEESRISAQVRRQTEGKFCQACGKLIVPFPIMLQGDSRRLAEVIQQAGGLVSSPPYANIDPEKNGSGINIRKQWETYRASGGGQDFESFARTQAKHSQGYGHTPGQLAGLPEGKPVIVASPPYVQALNGGEGPGARYDFKTHSPGNAVKQTCEADYGRSPGQLAKMPEGRPLVVSSPPFAGNSGGRGEASRNGIDPALFDRHQGAMVGGIGSAGNLAGLKPGDVAIVTSPPYEESLDRGVVDKQTRVNYARANGLPSAAHVSPIDMERVGARNQEYGATAGQLGTESGETFWSAAAVIISQCYQLLPPGAPAVWVVKSFVRDGAIVDFPGQWQALCEACGFETVEVIRAWLVKDKGTQMDLNGNGIKQRIERKSFFRRTGEQNTRARKHWQTLGRDDQGRLLRVSHTALWADYWSKLNTDKPVPRPNRSRILRNAQAGAYTRDGKPHYEIETAIDYEVVLVTRKRVGANDANP